MAVFEVTFPLVLPSSDQFARPQKQHDNNAETIPQNDDEQLVDLSRHTQKSISSFQAPLFPSNFSRSI